MMQIDNVGFNDALLLPEYSFRGIDYNYVDSNAKRESIKGCRESSNCFYEKGANQNKEMDTIGAQSSLHGADKPFF